MTPVVVSRRLSSSAVAHRDATGHFGHFDGHLSPTATLVQESPKIRGADPPMAPSAAASTLSVELPRAPVPGRVDYEWD